MPPRPPTPPGDPLLGNTRQFVSDPFGFVRRAAAETGDVFRMRLVGTDVYVLAGPDAVETALLDRESFAKLDDFQVAFGDALLSAEGDQWRRQRHAMEDFFSPTRVGEYADTMVDVARRQIADWTPGDTVGVHRAMATVALRNLFEVVLGHSLDDGELDDIVDEAQALNGWFEPTSWVLPEWVPTPARYRFRRGSAALRERADGLLADAGATPRGESLLATLSALASDPDSGFDRAEVLDQVVGMLFAGHETTAFSMTCALHQLGAHPAVAERLHDELATVLDGPPTLADLQELSYLDRIINETFRLYPAVHAIPRVTTDAVEVGGHAIPSGATVLCSVWSIHRDDRFYDDPLAFDPDRWAETTPRERGYRFVPFGAGPRICIGRHMARLEAKATLATIGQRFGLDAEGSLDVSPKMTTQPDGPVPIRLSERS